MILKIHPDNPADRKIKIVREVLEKDGVIIYPTDTVYALGCSIHSKKGIDKICKIRGLKPKKANLTVICNEMSQVTALVRPLDNPTFRILKQYLPGPYTFIFNAANKLPGIFKKGKNTIGIRLPVNPINQSIIESLGSPILSMSLKAEDDFLEYLTDPEEIYAKFKNQVDLVIDGGNGKIEGSTIVDLTGNEPILIRQGVGPFDLHL